MQAVAVALPRARARSLPAPGLAIAGITLLAAALRLLALSRVAGNPFYDAAVRSMGGSAHAFFYGAFDPSATTAIDKPPVDLWLQVASTKLLGFNGVALKLPEAIASTLSVPLLYATLRRAFGTTAGIAGALVLAVLPLAVLTGRSDTMDGVMGLALLASLWCLVRAGETSSPRWVYAAAACVGLAFNVKLFEALVPLPALAAGAWLALAPLTRWRRAAHLLGAAATLAGVAVLWLAATSFDAHRPFAIGSTDGSAWNAAFAFNGIDRIAGPASDPGTAPTAPRATPNSQARDVHIPPPGVTRLLAGSGPLPAARFGLLLLAALVLGIPGLVALGRGPPAARVAAVTLALWVVTGAVLFSTMARLHPRYAESVTAAVAGACAAGVLWITRRARRRGAAITIALIALLTVPGADARHIVSAHLSDSGRPGSMPGVRVRRLSAFLRAHQDGARYEFASAAATQAGPLIARDGRPVLLLTSFLGRPLVSSARLARLAAAGEVRYALLGGTCGRPARAVCGPAASWVRTHGIDVSRAARVYGGLLWRIGGHPQLSNPRR